MTDNHPSQTPSIRAQWIAIVFAIAMPTIVTWIYFVWFDGKSAVVGGIGKLIQFSFPAVWIFLVCRLPLAEAGLPKSADSESPPKDALWSHRESLAIGTLLGIGIVGLMIGYYRFMVSDETLAGFSQEVAARVEKLSLDNVVGYAVLGLFYSIIHSGLEEYYFRWFVFGRLRHLVSFPVAALVSGLAFMAHHVIVLSTFFGVGFHSIFLSFAIAVGGFLWAYQYERSRSIFGSWLSHALVDAGIFLVGYHLIFVVLRTAGTS